MQKQWCTFNQDIRNEIEDAVTKVSSGKVKKAKRLFEGCVNRIKKRNKLLKIVDKSPAGWLIADEYETNDCVSDSADDKKIRKAEKAALQRRYEAQQLYRSSRWRSPTNTSTNPGGSTAFAAQGCKFPYTAALSDSPKYHPAIPMLRLWRIWTLASRLQSEPHFQRQSRIHINPSMFPGVVNRNRNCNGSKKEGSNVKSGKPGKASIKELKDKYPLDQNYFEMEEAFLFRYEYKVTSNFDFDKNLSEYEKGESEICVKGRLKLCLHFWQEIGANENVLDVLENGYKIPFTDTPKPAEFKNNKSALLNGSFVSDSIQEQEPLKTRLSFQREELLTNKLSLTI